jgi:hypothetical protein
MKIIATNIFFLCLFILRVSAQDKAHKFLSKTDILGVWQRDTKLAGSGLNQHIHFFPNGDFHMDLGNDGDDLRTVIELNGKYRFSNDSLFFTITSKTILKGGDITISDPGIGLSIFTIENGKVEYIKIPNPKELKDPCFITVITKDHIKINNEVYYKIYFRK